MSDTDLARTFSANELTFQRTSGSRSGMALHRGDVTTVQDAASGRLQRAKRIKKLQAHAPSHRTAGTAAAPKVVPRIGQA